jgi:hypothetical protein
MTIVKWRGEGSVKSLELKLTQANGGAPDFFCDPPRQLLINAGLRKPHIIPKADAGSPPVQLQD